MPEVVFPLESLNMVMTKENFSLDPTQEEYLLETLPLIRRIAARRLSRRSPEAVDDIAQRVALKLWRWNIHRQIKTGTDEGRIIKPSKKVVGGKNGSNGSGRHDGIGNCDGYRPEPLTAEEWRKLANRATENEIKTFYAAKHQKEIQLTGNSATNGGRIDIDRLLSVRIEGSTAYEQRSQLCGIWKSFGNLTLRERYAFALKERTLCSLLVAYGCCRVSELAAMLEVSRADFIGVYQSLPLDEKQIARLLEKKLGKRVAPSLVTKSRQRARMKVRRTLTNGNSDGKASDKEET